jgi:tRNA threonylcarbamoyladenosine biosynthesis protein TsaB
VPSLDILAASQPVYADRLAAVARAGRGRLAVGWYSNNSRGIWKPEGGENSIQVLSAEALNDLIATPTQVCGELSEEEQRLLGRRRKIVLLASPALSLRRPAVLAELAWRRWKAGRADDPHTLAPIYLHTNDPVPG